MTKPKIFIRLIFVFLVLAFLYMERANEHRSDFEDTVSQFYRLLDDGQTDSLELYANKVIKFKDSNWTFSENIDAVKFDLSDMSFRESVHHVYKIKEEISDDLNHKIRIIRRLFFGLFIASMLIIYIIEDHVLKRVK